MPDAATTRRVARRLWNLIEPIASSVYFVAEAQAAYARLGLDNYAVSYFCSRSACMGRVPGAVVAAAFGVFNPAIVEPSVAAGWEVTTPDALLAARLEGASGGLARMLGDGVASADDVGRATTLLVRAGDAAAERSFAGRPLFGGLRSLGMPGDGELGDLWRAADVLREHRGDSHVIAWTAMGLTPVEIGLLTELWWGGKAGRYIRTRGWTDDDIASGLASLQERGFVTAGDEPAFTDAGEQLRAVVEEMTDNGEAAIVDALGDDADALFSLLQPWTAAVLAANGYPRDPATLPRAE